MYYYELCATYESRIVLWFYFLSAFNFPTKNIFLLFYVPTFILIWFFSNLCYFWFYFHLRFLSVVFWIALLFSSASFLWDTCRKISFTFFQSVLLFFTLFTVLKFFLYLFQLFQAKSIVIYFEFVTSSCIFPYLLSLFQNFSSILYTYVNFDVLKPVFSYYYNLYFKIPSSTIIGLFLLLRRSMIFRFSIVSCNCILLEISVIVSFFLLILCFLYSLHLVSCSIIRSLTSCFYIFSFILWNSKTVEIYIFFHYNHRFSI